MTPLNKPVHRVTRGALDDKHGADKARRLVATLADGDLLILRPQGTRRPESLSLFDVYEMAIRYRVNCARLEKAREKKAKIAIKRRSR